MMKYILALIATLLVIFLLTTAQLQQPEIPSKPVIQPLPSSVSEGEFVASKHSDVYHEPHCSYAQRIKPENRVWFLTAREAEKKGYRKALAC